MEGRKGEEGETWGCTSDQSEPKGREEREDLKEVIVKGYKTEQRV